MLALVLGRPAQAEELDVALARDLGDGLFAAGDAVGALQWYRTARWLEPSAAELPGVQVRVGMGLEATGDFAAAQDWYRRVDLGDPQLARLRAGICVSRLGAPDRGNAELVSLSDDFPALRPTVDMVRGALWVEAGALDAAAQAFAAVPAAHPQGPTAAGIAALAGAPPHRKSPGVAAGLSLLPGAGQMYVGQWGRGLGSLAMVGALFGGAWWTTSQATATGAAGWSTVAGGLGAAGLGTWSWTVVRAWRSAEGAAAEARAAHVAAVQERLDTLLPEIPLAPSPDQLQGL